MIPVPFVATPMSDISSLALPHIQKLHAYTPGLQPTESGWVKLNTNECPYPPSPRVAEAVLAELADGGERLRLYPNPKATPLRADFSWPRADKRQEFLRVRRNAQGGLDLFPNQSSGVLTSAVWGDGLVDNPAGQTIQPGDRVRFIAFAELLA